MTEGEDPDLNLLYWLFANKGVMPWEVYGQPSGYRLLACAFASAEIDQRSGK